MLGVGVERSLAWTQSSSAAPVQEIVECDRFQTRLGAAEREAHEMAIAAIQPIIIAAVAGQFGDGRLRALKISRGYNSNENFVHSTATSVLGSH